MGAIDTSMLPYGVKSAGVVDRGRKKAEKATALEKCYAKVDLRDESLCWVTGLKLSPSARENRLRREHHHLVGRVGDARHSAFRVITVSALVHELITRHVLLVIGTDATKPIFFEWNGWSSFEQNSRHAYKPCVDTGKRSEASRQSDRPWRRIVSGLHRWMGRQCGNGVGGGEPNRSSPSGVVLRAATRESLGRLRARHAA
jgi:hypothetical protein